MGPGTRALPAAVRGSLHGPIRRPAGPAEMWDPFPAANPLLCLQVTIKKIKINTFEVRPLKMKAARPQPLSLRASLGRSTAPKVAAERKRSLGGFPCSSLGIKSFICPLKCSSQPTRQQRTNPRKMVRLSSCMLLPHPRARAPCRQGLEKEKDRKKNRNCIQIAKTGTWANLKPPFKTTTVTRHGPSACSRFEAFLCPSPPLCHTFLLHVSTVLIDPSGKGRCHHGELASPQNQAHLPSPITHSEPPTETPVTLPSSLNHNTKNPRHPHLHRQRNQPGDAQGLLRHLR